MRLNKLAQLFDILGNCAGPDYRGHDLLLEHGRLNAREMCLPELFKDFFAGKFPEPSVEVTLADLTKSTAVRTTGA